MPGRRLTIVVFRRAVECLPIHRNPLRQITDSLEGAVHSIIQSVAIETIDPKVLTPTRTSPMKLYTFSHPPYPVNRNVCAAGHQGSIYQIHLSPLETADLQEIRTTLMTSLTHAHHLEDTMNSTPIMEHATRVPTDLVVPDGLPRSPPGTPRAPTLVAAPQKLARTVNEPDHQVQPARSSGRSSSAIQHFALILSTP